MSTRFYAWMVLFVVCIGLAVFGGHKYLNSPAPSPVIIPWNHTVNAMAIGEVAYMKDRKLPAGEDGGYILKESDPVFESSRDITETDEIVYKYGMQIIRKEDGYKVGMSGGYHPYQNTIEIPQREVAR